MITVSAPIDTWLSIVYVLEQQGHGKHAPALCPPCAIIDVIRGEIEGVKAAVPMPLVVSTN